MLTVSPSDRTFRVEQRVGLGLIAAGLVANPWVLGLLFAPDGTLDGEARVRTILLVDLFLTLFGLWMAWPRPRNWFGGFARQPLAAAAVLAVVSSAIVGTWWGISAYRGAHHHTMNAAAMAAPTEAQRQWADEFVARCFESARRHGWLNFETALADGFKLQWDDRSHYVNREFLFDQQILDPDRPEFLMYRDTPRGKLLMGYMFYARSIDERGPQPGGSLALWHYHPWGPRGYCAEGGLLPVSRPGADGSCTDGQRVLRSAEMLHVWFIDHPLGPFADAMLFPDRQGFDLSMLHPMVVHFTIALLIAAVALDLLGRLSRRDGLHTAAFVNLVLAGVVAVPTVAAGMLAEVRLLIGHDVHQVLDTHKLLGFSSLGGIVALLAWRLALRGRFPRRGGIVYLGAGLLVAAITAGAGYYGAELVYVRGVAVQAIDRLALERRERAVFGGEGDKEETVPQMPAGHLHGK
jgi:uncharacterized membrane protein